MSAVQICPYGDVACEERPIGHCTDCPQRSKKPPQGMVCPFCKADDFDGPGLYSHITRDCKVGAALPPVRRIFG